MASTGSQGVALAVDCIKLSVCLSFVCLEVLQQTRRAVELKRRLQGAVSGFAVLSFLRTLGLPRGPTEFPWQVVLVLEKLIFCVCAGTGIHLLCNILQTVSAAKSSYTLGGPKYTLMSLGALSLVFVFCQMTGAIWTVVSNKESTNSLSLISLGITTLLVGGHLCCALYTLFQYLPKNRKPDDKMQTVLNSMKSGQAPAIPNQNNCPTNNVHLSMTSMRKLKAPTKTETNSMQDRDSRHRSNSAPQDPKPCKSTSFSRNIKRMPSPPMARDAELKRKRNTRRSASHEAANLKNFVTEAKLHVRVSIPSRPSVSEITSGERKEVKVKSSKDALFLNRSRAHSAQNGSRNVGISNSLYLQSRDFRDRGTTISHSRCTRETGYTLSQSRGVMDRVASVSLGARDRGTTISHFGRERTQAPDVTINERIALRVYHKYKRRKTTRRKLKISLLVVAPVTIVCSTVCFAAAYWNIISSDSYSTYFYRLNGSVHVSTEIVYALEFIVNLFYLWYSWEKANNSRQEGGTGMSINNPSKIVNTWGQYVGSHKSRNNNAPITVNC